MYAVYIALIDLLVFVCVLLMCICMYMYVCMYVTGPARDEGWPASEHRSPPPAASTLPLPGPPDRGRPYIQPDRPIKQLR